MNINIEKNNGLCELQIEGEMTIFNAAELKKQLLCSLAECQEIKIDLSEVSEMDTAGLQLLLLVGWEAKRLNKHLRITSYSTAILSVLELFRIDLTTQVKG